MNGPPSADGNDTCAECGGLRQRALGLLARREHAPAELAGKLEARGHARAMVAAVCDELIDDGLLSAARYADAVVASRVARGIGPRRIRAELAAVQIPESEIERALEAAAVDWLALAEAARVKRFGAEGPGDFPTRAKQMRFLQRRGFSVDLLRPLLD